MITVVTGLIPLFWEFNLKRKHKEDMVSDMEEPKERQFKKFRRQQVEGSYTKGTTNVGRSTSKIMTKCNEIRRRILRGPRKGTNYMGSGGSPQTTTQDQ